jgi:hypothetical protein
MYVNPILIIVAVVIAALVFIAIGIALIFLGSKAFRSGSKKNIFIGNQNFDKMPDDVQKIFDSFPDIFNNLANNQQNTGAQNTQTHSAYNQEASNSKPYENTQNASDIKQPIPASPFDKQPGLNYTTKAMIIVLVWMTGFIAVLMAVIGFTDDVIAPILRNAGFSEISIAIVFLFIFMAIFSLAMGVLFFVRNKMNKSLPQYFVKGTVAVKKIVQRRVRTGKHYVWRNFCVLTIALENNACADFDTPPAIYNAVRERDFVNVVYNRLSDNEFLIVNLNR